MRTDVITTVTGSGIITQGLQFSNEGGPYDDMLYEMRDRMHMRVIDLMDQQVREALIHLGWTPPPDGFKPKGGVDAKTI